MDARTMNDLARRWILIWNDGDPRTLPLAEDFEHVSPFGTIRGRETYLEQVIAAAAENVTGLAVDDVIVGDGCAAVRYRYRAKREGMPEVAACDWLRFEGDKIAGVTAYFDPRAVIGEGE